MTAAVRHRLARLETSGCGWSSARDALRLRRLSLPILNSDFSELLVSDGRRFLRARRRAVFPAVCFYSSTLLKPSLCRRHFLP